MSYIAAAAAASSYYDDNLYQVSSPTSTRQRTAIMSGDFRNSVEPFPLFIDSAPPNSANYFSSPMAMAAVQLLALSSSSDPSYTGTRIPRVVLPVKLSKYIQQRYYQYEVTFGLYMMSPVEKRVFNGIIFALLVALVYALSWGLQGLLIDGLCKLIYHLTGSLSTAPGACTIPR